MSEGGSGYDSGYSGRDSIRAIAGNADFQNSIGQVRKKTIQCNELLLPVLDCTSMFYSIKVIQLLENLHSTRQHLHQVWQMKKMKLDQCFQLRLFEQDANKVSDAKEHSIKYSLI